MRPISFTVKDFQGLDYTFNYRPGILGITGANGAGKTTLADYAQFYAWTGNTPPGISLKDLPTYDVKSGHTSLLFDAGPCRYQVDRTFPSNGAVLTGYDQDGKQTEQVSGVKKTAERMGELLDLDMDIFREVCFVPQEKVSQFLTDTSAPRLNYLMKITRLDMAERIREDLQAGLSDIRMPPDTSEDIKSLKSDIKETRSRIDELGNEIGRIEKAAEDRKDELERAEKISGLPVDGAVEERRQELESGINRLSEKSAVTVPELPEVPEVTDADREALKYPERIRELKELEETGRERLSPLEYEEKIKAEMDRDRELYKMARDQVCPTCKRPYEMENPEEVLRRERDLKEGLKTVEGLLEELKLPAQYNRLDTEGLREMIQSREAERTELEKKLETVDLDEIRDRIKRSGEMRQEYDRILKMSEEKSRCERELEKKRRELEGLDSSETVSQETADWAKNEIRKGRERQAGLDEARTEKNRLEGSSGEMVKNLEKAEKSLKERQEAEKKYNFLTGAQDLFHRDRLPRRILMRLLGEFNSRLRTYCAEAGISFAGYLNRQLEFRAVDRNGRDVPVMSLSTGQRFILSCLVHFVKGEMFRRVPVMVLDEPTAYMDREHLEDVRRVLSSMRDKAEKGIWMQVITHDETLAPCFTEVLRVGEDVVRKV